MIAAVLDHLWQSTLFAVCAGALTLAYRNNGARVRYGLWFASSIKFLVPFALLTGAGDALIRLLSRPVIAPPRIAGVEQVAQPFAASEFRLLHALPGAALDLGLIPVIIWAIGFAAVLGFWFVRWRRVRMMLQAATPLSTSTAFPMTAKSTTASFEPGLVGIWNPVLLLPESILTRLSAQEMAAIVEHEACHMRRRDNMTAAIHMIVEAVFWFHPLVWWLGGQLIAERERACDEGVVTAGSDPQTYAEAILKVCKFYVQSPLACASGVSGADLKKRIEHIMTNRIKLPVNFAKRAVLAATATAAVAVPLVMGFVAWTPAQALTNASERLSFEEGERRLAEQQRPRTAVPFDPAAFDKYVGFYQSGPYGFMSMTREGSHFFASGGVVGQTPQKIEIYPESPTKFFAVSEGHPGQISFVADAAGNTTGIVFHGNGYEMPAPKVTEAALAAAAAELAERVRKQTPSPGTEAAIRRFVGAFEHGESSYSQMAPEHAYFVLRQFPKYVDSFRKWGPLQSLRFVELTDRGMEKYQAVFAHGGAELIIEPLNRDGKITGVGFGKIEE